MEIYNPRIVCFSCNFGWGYLSDEATIGATVLNWIPVVCSGKIDTDHILKAFQAGADGVLILGCTEGHCHFQDGNYHTRKKVFLIHKVLDAFGIDPKRLVMELDIDPEGKKIPQLIAQMRQHIVALGPMKAREMLQ
jgi:coenzyme F420-reducing hydrogenase delta subunit